MSAQIQLPKPNKKKKINLQEFVSLAKKVKKIFEEEDEFLRKQEEKNGNKAPHGLSISY